MPTTKTAPPPTQPEDLPKLRQRLWEKPANAICQIGDYRLRITDGPNAYMQYKDVFVHGIYRFTATRPDPLIIDGGSNMGLSVLGFKHDHPGARVVAFEPDPAIADLLAENLDRNHIADVAIYPCKRTSGGAPLGPQVTTCVVPNRVGISVSS